MARHRIDGDLLPVLAVDRPFHRQRNRTLPGGNVEVDEHHRMARRAVGLDEARLADPTSLPVDVQRRPLHIRAVGGDP